MTTDIESTPIQNSIFLNDGSHAAEILRHCVTRFTRGDNSEFWRIGSYGEGRYVGCYWPYTCNQLILAVSSDGCLLKVSEQYRDPTETPEDVGTGRALVAEYCELLNEQQSFFECSAASDHVNVSSVLERDSLITTSDVDYLLDWNSEASALVADDAKTVRDDWLIPEDAALRTCAEFEAIARGNFTLRVASHMPRAQFEGE